MLRNSDYKYFNKARSTALLSDFTKTHIGCVAVYQGQVIGLGCNLNKTHTTQKFYNRYRENDITIPKIHAEISCLNQIKHLNINYSKVRLYIYRIRKDQPYGIARPCLACMAAIRDLGIKHIYYTTNDGFAYENVMKLEKGGVA